MQSTRWPFLLAALLAWHCSGTPQTDPPNLDPGHLQLEPPVRGTKGTQWVLKGGPGSAEPAGAVVHVVNLDTQDAEAVATVGADGAFQVQVSATPGETLRVQIVAGSERSNPIDLVVDASSVRVASPSIPCLTTVPASQFAFRDQRAVLVEIRSQCEQVVSISGARLRFGSTAFSLGDVPLDVAPGTSVSLPLSYLPSGSADQDILILEFSAPAQDRRALSLFGK